MNPTLAPHPLADIFPAIPDADLERLAEDIRAHGQLQPIVLYEGKILDGRHRYEACRRLGIRPKVEEYEGEDPIGFVVSLNLHRRHLTESQRAACAAEVANLRRGDNQHSPIGETSVSQADAAKMLNVSKRSVERAAKVKERAPDLLDAVKRGELKVSAAEKIARLPEEERPAAVERAKAPRKQVPRSEPRRPSTPVVVAPPPASDLYDSYAAEFLGDIDVRPDPSCAFVDPWRGRAAWLRPSCDYDTWAKTMLYAVEQGALTEALMLVPAMTHAAWFRRLWSQRICFVFGREMPGTQQVGAALVYVGPRADEFTEAFHDRLGHVSHPTDSRN